MPAAERLLYDERGSQHRFFGKRLAHNLHPYGQAFTRTTRRNTGRREIEDIERLRITEGAKDVDPLTFYL